jgi:hypothetical protein
MKKPKPKKAEPPPGKAIVSKIDLPIGPVPVKPGSRLKVAKK